ncbi:MBL fold metallo-hydrolase [bacterium 1XD42-8]|nr:MBL fold metallo-hydrolase [bacterium 1XD42-8]
MKKHIGPLSDKNKEPPLLTKKRAYLLLDLFLLFFGFSILINGFLLSQVKESRKKLEDLDQILKEHSKTFLQTTTEDGSVVVAATLQEDGSYYTFYQMPMTGNAGGCFYGILLPDQSLIIIDGGYEGESYYVLDFIKEHGGKVHSWFVTHPHFDHVGALVDILSQEDYGGITIDTIYYDPFTPEFFHEEGEGKDLNILNNASLFDSFESLRSSDPRSLFVPLNIGDQLTIEDIDIRCLMSFQPEHYDVNGNCLVLHFDIKGFTFLITGDMTDYSIALMRQYWGDTSPYWNVDFLQIPHHGYIAGISSNLILQLTTPRYALLDCSKEEYDNNAVNIRTFEDWVLELDIPILKRFTGPNQIIIH